MRSLPVWIAASLAAGAWTGLQLPLSQHFAPAALIVLLAATVSAFARDDAPAVLCRALAGCVVASWALASTGEREARATPLAKAAGSLASPVPIEGTLLADAVPDEDSVRLKVDVSRLARAGAPDGAASLNVTGAIALKAWPAWRAGRQIALPASVRAPSRYLDAGVDDDRLALARRGLVLVGSVKSGALVDVVSRGSWLEERAADLRAFVRAAIARYVGARDPVAGAVATAILIGDRTGLSAELEDRLQRAGTYHVIAISGGNIAIFAATLVGLARLLRMSPRITNVLIVVILWGYAALVGGGASVARATAMASAFLLLRVCDLAGGPVCGARDGVRCPAGGRSDAHRRSWLPPHRRRDGRHHRADAAADVVDGLATRAARGRCGGTGIGGDGAGVAADFGGVVRTRDLRRPAAQSVRRAGNGPGPAGRAGGGGNGQPCLLDQGHRRHGAQIEERAGEASRARTAPPRLAAARVLSPPMPVPPPRPRAAPHDISRGVRPIDGGRRADGEQVAGIAISIRFQPPSGQRTLSRAQAKDLSARIAHPEQQERRRHRRGARPPRRRRPRAHVDDDDEHVGDAP